MNKTVLIYWPKGGNVEKASIQIAKEFGDIDVVSLNEVSKDTLNKYDKYVIGGSTVGAETWEATKTGSPWNTFIADLKKYDFTSKKVALFGLGDQVLWPANFVDGLRTIYNAVSEANAQIIGKWPIKGYDFTESTAVTDGYFVGLALDLDQQDELTDERVKAWVKQIKKEF